MKGNDRTVSAETDDASGMIKENAIENAMEDVIENVVENAIEYIIEDVIKETLQDLHSTGKAVVETASPEETFAFGKMLGAMCRPGELYTLIGDLGVGKTVFTQGFAAGLGIEETVNSPTFTILQIYEEGRIPLYHFDVYRIADVEEMDEVGYEDCFYGDGVCLVEWADLIKEILPEQYTQVTIEKDPQKGFDYRRITLERRCAAKADKEQ